MTTATMLEEFEDICADCEEIFIAKNEEYGNAIVETGLLGACVELVGTVARLKKLVLKSGNGGIESTEAIRNVLSDTHNYAVIGIMMMDSENFTGKENE